MSVKRMQAAVERLISLDEKWDPCPPRYWLGARQQPTNMEESWHNPADEIIVVVTLKRPEDPQEAAFSIMPLRIELMVRHS